MHTHVELLSKLADMKLFTQTHIPPVTSPVMGSTFLVMMRSVSGVVPSARSMMIGIRTGIRGNTVGGGGGVAIGWLVGPCVHTLIEL